jgi:aryl-alcohol dehydrogenase-like predicted oxidoreductase
MPLTRGDRRSAITLLRRAVAPSVTHIDTAGSDGPARASNFSRAAPHPYPQGLVIAAKVGYRRSERGRLVPAPAPSQLRAGVEADLRSLAISRLPVVNLRLEDPPSGISPARVSLDDQLAEQAASLHLQPDHLAQLGRTWQLRPRTYADMTAMNRSWWPAVANHRSLTEPAGSQNTPLATNRPQEVKGARSLV